jgi:hypothetical protein
VRDCLEKLTVCECANAAVFIRECLLPHAFKPPDSICDLYRVNHPVSLFQEARYTDKLDLRQFTLDP